VDGSAAESVSLRRGDGGIAGAGDLSRHPRSLLSGGGDGGAATVDNGDGDARDDGGVDGDGGAAFDSRAFRNALGAFPTGVCVVTARVSGDGADAGDGEDLGMTMSSFNSLSLAPPLVLFSIGRQSHSLAKWQRAAGYAIHVLADGQTEISGRFARPLGDKWAALEFDRGHAGAPLLRGVLARFECRAHARHDGGDHVLFIAEVLRFTVFQNRAPLLSCRGHYAQVKPTDEPAPLWPLAIHY